MKNCIIAITGGIASGKSTAARILEAKGAKVLYADNINQQLLNKPFYIDLVEKSFPNVIINGEIDKKLLAKEVFSDPQKLTKLNEISHPLILQKIKEQAKVHKGIVFVEMPLMNKQFAKIFDEIWLIDAPVALRTRRASERDGRGEEQTKDIIKAQSGYDYSADKVIINDQGIEQLKNKVLTEYRNLKVDLR